MAVSVIRHIHVVAYRNWDTRGYLLLCEQGLRNMVQHPCMHVQLMVDWVTPTENPQELALKVLKDQLGIYLQSSTYVYTGANTCMNK